MSNTINAKIVAGTDQQTANDLAQLKQDASADPSQVAADLQKLSQDWQQSGFDSSLMVGRIDTYLSGGSHALDASALSNLDSAMASQGITGQDSDYVNWLANNGSKGGSSGTPTEALAASGGSGGTDGSGGTSATTSTYSGNIQQSGTGWTGDVNVASTSANYEGLSLDQLMQSNSGIGQALRAHPDIVSAIEQVSGQTGAPAGLLAGVIYQESGFDVNSTSGNPDPTAQDSSDLGLCQCPNGDFTGDEWKDPYTNIMDFASKYLMPSYEQSGSWGVALRDWNTGSTSNPNDLSQENNNTDPNYVTEILQNHCMGLD